MTSHNQNMETPSTTHPPLLQVSHLVKSYDGVPVLRDVSFDVDRGEIVCLLGPSGCGKSTLLSIIAGLDQPDSGLVLVDGTDIVNTPVHRRGFGLMFQGLALFPHRNVRDNIAFGLRMAGQSAAEINERVAEVLTLVGLAGFESRDVNQLSGGEQQRIALARSLAPRPRLLMLDEPLSSLDRTLRERLMDELRRILTHVGQTAIYVTHDQQEAFALSDRMVILDAGQVAQIGTPHEVFSTPADTFVARFLGLNNLIPGHVSDVHSRHVDTQIGTLQLASDTCRNGDVSVLVRPDAATTSDSVNSVCGRLVERSFRGRHTRITMSVNDVLLEFELDSSATLPPVGSPFGVGLRPESIICLPSNQTA